MQEIFGKGRHKTNAGKKGLVGARLYYYNRETIACHDKTFKIPYFSLEISHFNIIAYIQLTYSRKNKNNYLCENEISSRKKKCSTITDLIFLKEINNTNSFFQIFKNYFKLL